MGAAFLPSDEPAAKDALDGECVEVTEGSMTSSKMAAFELMEHTSAAPACDMAPTPGGACPSCVRV